jgi:hypothetical protein
VRVADVFFATAGLEVFSVWPYESTNAANHFLFEAAPARLAALVTAVAAHLSDPSSPALAAYFERHRAAYDAELDAVRAEVSATEYEEAERAAREASAELHPARIAVALDATPGDEGTRTVRATRWRRLRLHLERLARLHEIAGAAAAAIEVPALLAFVRAPEEAAASRIVAARDLFDQGRPHDLFTLCLQTALVGSAANVGLGGSVRAGGRPRLLLPSRLIEDEDAEAAVDLENDGLYDHMQLITYGSGSALAAAARSWSRSRAPRRAAMTAALEALAARDATAISWFGECSEDA